MEQNSNRVRCSGCGEYIIKKGYFYLDKKKNHICQNSNFPKLHTPRNEDFNTYVNASNQHAGTNSDH